MCLVMTDSCVKRRRSHLGHVLSGQLIHTDEIIAACQTHPVKKKKEKKDNHKPINGAKQGSVRTRREQMHVKDCREGSADNEREGSKAKISGK